MSFPISPSNNQTVVLNGITYLYNTANQSWTRQLPVNTSTSIYTSFVDVLNTTPSTSTTTGALIITGGVGIGGAVNIGQTSTINGAQILTTATAISLGKMYYFGQL